jgi:hypothetical protein
VVDRGMTETVAATIRRHRFPFGDEDQLQEGIAAALAAAGFAVEREVRLRARDRIDLLVDGRVGVEIKIDGATRRVLSQLRRYAEHDQVAELVLVTRCARHQVPRSMNGKSVTVVNLAGVGL